ncbi:MAG: elongation factor P [Nitrospiria bacterium]
MITTTDFRGGLKLEVDGEPMEIIDYQHVKPGKGGAFVRTKMRNLKTGNVLERTFRSGEKFEEPQVEEKRMQYLYLQEGEFHFMDVKSYEQLFLSKTQLGDSWQFLKENMEVDIVFCKGKPLGVNLPLFVELKIVETAPGIRGDTATGGTKPATLESGAVVKVPFHIDQGTIIKVDTRTKAYVERVKGP